uniref:Uncharacterized protein n=1 Tax=Caenorhabditis tropicalis TaxID=1561998 RepID=A0A1I7TI72_9PELO
MPPRRRLGRMFWSQISRAGVSKEKEDWRLDMEDVKECKWRRSTTTRADGIRDDRLGGRDGIGEEEQCLLEDVFS